MQAEPKLRPILEILSGAINSRHEKINSVEHSTFLIGGIKGGISIGKPIPSRFT